MPYITPCVNYDDDNILSHPHEHSLTVVVDAIQHVLDHARLDGGHTSIHCADPNLLGCELNSNGMGVCLAVVHDEHFICVMRIYDELLRSWSPS